MEEKLVKAGMMSELLGGEDQVGVKLLAEILSNMDTEITALEEKLVKAGMMSELLGWVRSV